MFNDDFFFLQKTLKTCTQICCKITTKAKWLEKPNLSGRSKEHAC